MNIDYDPGSTRGAGVPSRTGGRVVRRVYLDYNATTPLLEEVKRVIVDTLDVFGNPSSAHSFGREARERVENARCRAASLLGARPRELFFTSGGSEGNNLVLRSVACRDRKCPIGRRKVGGPPHVITSAVEHPSVRETCRCLEREGVEVTYLPVDSTGMVDPEDVRKAIRPHTLLISIMAANNEVGTIQPVEEIGKVAAEAGVPFHCDAVQYFAKKPIDVQRWGVSYLTASAHKIGASKGTGILYVRRDVHVCPLITGGHQEAGLRAGTENTIGIAALGEACRIFAERGERMMEEVRRLRDRLEKGIFERIPDVRLNGHPERRMENTLNVSFAGVEGEAILYRLDFEGIAVSTGSACSTGSLEPSPVLTAMGLSHKEAHGSIRMSVGWETTDEDIDYVLDVLPRVIADLRRMSPLYDSRKGKK